MTDVPAPDAPTPDAPAPDGEAARDVRRGQVLVAALLFVAAAAAPLLDALELWPLAAIGAFVGALLLWTALKDESIAAPVVALVLAALPAMWAHDGLAIGPLASVVLAVMLGEHLAVCRSTRYATPGHVGRAAGLATVGLHGGAAVAAMSVTLVATLLPEARPWSLAVVAAIGGLAIALQRRRALTPDVALPPPAPPA
jgi:hypothetical protein